MPIINNFQNGVVNDPRDTATGVCRACTNFDTITSPRRLIPYRCSEDGDGNATTSQKQNFCLALRTGTTYSLYALGVKSGVSTSEILYKNLTTGSSTDLDDSSWAATSNNQGATDAVRFECFIYYKNQALIYGIQGNNIFSYDPSGTAAISTTGGATGVTITSAAQGLVHSQDDVLYIAFNNIIASKNGSGAWNMSALILPSDSYITSICEYNQYIGIAIAPLSGIGNSRVLIWDRQSTLNTITENLTWGYGVIKVLEELNGYLIGISANLNDNVTNTTFKDKVTIKYYTGAGPKFFTVFEGTLGSEMPIAKQKRESRVYFMMAINLNGTWREGVWSFGLNTQGNFTLVHERTPNNDTNICVDGSTFGQLKNFFYSGEYLFQSFTLVSTGAFKLSKTIAGTVNLYNATSIYESQINANMAEKDKPLLKQITQVRITYNTLSAVAGQVVLKYKTDLATSWTTIATCTNTGLNNLTFPDASGVPFTRGQELEFRIESTLGAEIINFEYSYRVIPT